MDIGTRSIYPVYNMQHNNEVLLVFVFAFRQCIGRSFPSNMDGANSSRRVAFQRVHDAKKAGDAFLAKLWNRCSLIF